MTSYIIAMAVCLIMSAYFSATETAFSSLNKTRLKTFAEKGDSRAALTLKLAERYDRLISTILIGNNIVNIALASIGTVFFVKYVDENMGATISTVVITVVVLIFGEITPKSVANDFPEKFAMFSAPLIRVFIFLLMPLNFIFGGWKKLISKLFKIEDDDKMSQEELLMMVEEAEQEGGIDSEEGDLLRNAIEFSDLKAEDILTHRVDLEALPIDADKEEIAKLFTQTRFSRIPLYDESIDNIVGIIHQKDFYVGNGISKSPIKKLISPPLFIHQSERVDDILKKLQKEKSHIAVVVDEYGGTLGIVTMEDILEELVGDIWDEHDEVVEEFKRIDDNRYLVDCNVNLDDFCEFFEIGDLESDSVSCGGWVMEQMGNIPKKDDSFEYKNLYITVMETGSHRISTVQVEIREVKPDDDEKV